MRKADKKVSTESVNRRKNVNRRVSTVSTVSTGVQLTAETA